MRRKRVLLPVKMIPQVQRNFRNKAKLMPLRKVSRESLKKKSSSNRIEKVVRNLLLYTAVLRPILTYGSPAWGYAADSNIKTLEVAQNSIIRNIHAELPARYVEGRLIHLKPVEVQSAPLVWCGNSKRGGVPAHMLSSLFDHRSKLRSPSPIVALFRLIQK
ncbi:hypothetical protein TNCV_65871 [Trichonephila clavipes]|nr:hypothetical protein TNCV_65871 [Trichonephila clavipes]